MATRTRKRRAKQPATETTCDAMLLAVEDVAGLIGCSRRHVYRMADGRQMPAPVKVGALTRWRRDEIDRWISEGCKPLRRARRGGVR